MIQHDLLYQIFEQHLFTGAIEESITTHAFVEKIVEDYLSKLLQSGLMAPFHVREEIENELSKTLRTHS